MNLRSFIRKVKNVNAFVMSTTTKKQEVDTTSPMTKKQEVDVDTDISEVLDENAMRKLLYPEGYLLFSSFSLSVNRDALEGWVKQFSGCCCACAIAGSVNAVFGLGRPDEEEAKKSRHVLKKRPPLSRFDGLILLQDQIRVKVKRMVRRYVKKFELRSEENIIYEEDEKTPWIDPDTFNVFTPLLRELYERKPNFWSFRKEDGIIRSAKTKKRTKPTTVMWLRAIREIVNDDKETILNSFLREKLRDLDRETPPPGTESSDAKNVSASEDETLALAINAQRSIAFEVSGFGGSKKKKKTQSEWLPGLVSILKYARGLCKLDVSCNKPSTYICGNSVLIDAVRALNDRLDYDMVVRAKNLLGSKRGTYRRKGKKKIKRDESVMMEQKMEDDEITATSPPTVTTKVKEDKKTLYVSEKDGPEEKTIQWNHVRSVFDTPGKCVIFHLKNHYALVCAMRQYTIRDEKNRKCAKLVRELLTARKGQRPRHWISWDDAHSTLNSWVGYKIMVVGGEWLGSVDDAPSLTK